MEYALLIFHDDGAELSPQEIDDHPRHRSWLAEVRRRGAFVGGQRLRPGHAARTVRSRAGDTLVTDGPFTEAREQVGGFVLLDCADLDEATELAALHPFAALGAIEVRPVWSR
ncbi:transcription initiation protein [Micromonospora rosaria]|uniref:Transcription initiation protein n=1 Tax=Micromonospora rosaria TaxID=47874 RepID=A0A136PY82_9ACTN|nr:YciI family protein [Micromonospora rosaria]KXK63438.1 transcription initiation protein [Micromonospora rosaria]